MTSHVRLSVGWLVGRSVGLSVCHNFKKNWFYHVMALKICADDLMVRSLAQSRLQNCPASGGHIDLFYNKH